MTSILLPVASLSEDAFRARHRALLSILWLQVPLLAVAGWLSGWDPGGVAPDSSSTGMGNAAEGAVVAVRVMVIGLIGCAVAGMMIERRRPGAVVVSLGLLLSSAALVSVGGGLTELHFAFFVMLALISMYQDWVPLVLSAALVLIHHLVMGIVDPSMLFSDPQARGEPLRYALLHGSFVMVMCAVQVAYWHFAHQAQTEKTRIQATGEQKLRWAAERFEALVQDSSDAILVIDQGGAISSASAAVRHVMGYQPADLTGRRYRSLIHPDDLPRLAIADSQGSAEYDGEFRVFHADRTWHWHEITLRDMTDHPAVGALIANHRDVTERRLSQERLAYEASHDALTGLFNRAELLRILENCVSARTGDDSGSQIAVLYLDLNEFKNINDTHGHETGDAVLVAVASALRRCVLGADSVGRLGGDEFAVVLTNINSDDAAVAVARRILAEVRLPVAVNGITITPGISVGIAFSGPHPLETDELLRRADTAMYHAKRDRGVGWRLFVDGMHGPTDTADTLEDDLGRAVDADELRLQYQPIVELGSGTLIGFEVLVRWEHPTLGTLQPEQFIALAEQSRLIGRVGQWILREACSQIRKWHRSHPSMSRLSFNVNISLYQLDQPSIVSDVEEILDATGCPPSDLVLEITESALINADATIEQLEALHRLGVRIALDDFGTGYSSLRYLTRMPVDILKLDRCFVAELNGTPHGSAVAEAVIRLGRILHLDTVAEGVESAAQATELTLLGCHAGQGFHFSYPLDPQDVDTLLAGAGDSPPTLVGTSELREVGNREGFGAESP